MTIEGQDLRDEALRAKDNNRFYVPGSITRKMVEQAGLTPRVEPLQGIATTKRQVAAR